MPTRERKAAFARWLVGGGSVGVLLAAWYLVTGPLNLVNPIKFPSPSDVYDAFDQLVHAPGYADGTLIEHIVSSARLVVLGFLIAAGTGVPLGLAMGRSRLVDSYVNPVFQIIRPIAPIAWIPLTILWFGLGTSAKLFVIWLAAFAPSVINTYTGVRNIDTTVLQAATVHGASRWDLLLDVVIPGSLPSIFTGLRTSLQACWMVLVAAELVGSFVGLGHIMIIATRDLNSGMILVAMICVTLLGIAMSMLLTHIERWVIPWRR